MRKKTGAKRLVLMWLVTLFVCAYVLLCPLPFPFSNGVSIGGYCAECIADRTHTFKGSVYISGSFSNYLARTDRLIANLIIRPSGSIPNLYCKKAYFSVSDPVRLPLGGKSLSVRCVYNAELVPPSPYEKVNSLPKDFIAQRENFKQARFFLSSDLKKVFILLINGSGGKNVYLYPDDVSREDAIAFIDSPAEYF